MTVQSVTSRARYGTNATTGPWTVPFLFFHDSHVAVFHTDSGGVETRLTLATHYSVTGASNPAGGTVTTVAAYAAGGWITIIREVPRTQLVDYQPGDPFPAETHERALDLLTMLVQQAYEVLDRALVFAVSDTGIGQLPPVVDRANRLLAFDSLGVPTVSAAPTGTATSVLADLANSNSAALGDALVAYKRTHAGALAATLHQWHEAQFINAIVDFGMTPDGDFVTGAGTDNSPAFQAALNSLSTTGGGALFIPPGIYKLVSQVIVPGGGVSIIGTGKWSTLFFCPNAFANAGGLIRFEGAGGYPVCCHGIGVISQVGGCSGVGIYSAKNGLFLSDFWINGFLGGTGLIINSTDNFVHDFAIEICIVGITIKHVNVNISHGTLYECAQGLIVANAATVESNEVVVSDVRANICSQFAFSVGAGKQVSFINCVAAAEGAGWMATAGFLIDTASRVSLANCSARLLGTPSTTGKGLLLQGPSSYVNVSNCNFSGWLDGIDSVATHGLQITGGSSRGNGRHGIAVAGGDQVGINGVNCSDNGLAAGVGSGINANNTAAFAAYSITGCITVQGGGGPQDYGIDANLVDNGVNTGTTLIQGNTSLYNATADIRLTGLTGNIRLERGIHGSIVETPPGVASAASITLPLGIDTLLISGTTTITSIAVVGNARRTVTLIFQGALTFTDGSNLKLAGNFVTSADDTITLYCNGVDWFEVCRSTN